MVNKKKEESSKFEEQLYLLFLPLTESIKIKELETKLIQIDYPDDLSIYLSKHLFFAFFVPLILLLLGSFFAFATGNSAWVGNIVIICIFSFFGVLVYALLKPYLDVSAKVTTIKNSLSLSILSMSSIAESGAPPESMFHTAATKSESPELSKEFQKITAYMDHFGLSLPEAIDQYCKITPSIELKKFLFELKSNLASGGSLPEFMKKKAEHAQFTYKLVLDNMNKRAETFGDIYSAIVIAGPLFLFSSIMLLGMIGGGGFGGLSINTLMILGVFGIVPMINIIFIVVLQIIS
ncbi:MAG: type II secretion system F family protein [Candidatus ainarchaeum sp.]|nr:type II secretion system F family protein [Candidatus ainarchaeum sp.]